MLTASVFERSWIIRDLHRGTNQWNTTTCGLTHMHDLVSVTKRGHFAIGNRLNPMGSLFYFSNAAALHILECISDAIHCCIFVQFRRRNCADTHVYHTLTLPNLRHGVKAYALTEGRCQGMCLDIPPPVKACVLTHVGRQDTCLDITPSVKTYVLTPPPLSRHVS
jgi:hypothetical protein